MGQKRARQIHEKESRRQDILAAALRLWEVSPYEGVTMGGVAGEARLAKGTLYLYFPTKEALFLEMAERELMAFYEDLDEALARSPRPLGAEEAAGLLAARVALRPPMLRLLALLHGTLEANVEALAALRFRHFLATRILRTGRLLERHLGSLPEGEGPALLLRAQALVLGLWLGSDPSPAVRQVIDAPGLELFRGDFASTLRKALGELFAGALLCAAKV